MEVFVFIVTMLALGFTVVGIDGCVQRDRELDAHQQHYMERCTEDKPLVECQKRWIEDAKR